MSDRQSPTSTNLDATEDEAILEEDRSAGGSDGAALSRATVDAPVSGPESQRSGRIDIENEAASSHPQRTSTAHHHNVPRRPARKETLLGIPQPARANLNPNYDDDNYETRFPPDPIYREASSPNARVYRVYMEESAKYDTYMTDEAREGLDVLLVFAGLFSAVLTTLVAQTSQSLQPDRATETTLLLREVASLQRAQINGTSIDSIPSTPTDFTPSAIDVWVNGLWFTSLTLSLASALFAVLIKQWIRQYTSLVSGTARERSLIRQYRFMGLEQWHVPTLIGILPALMHLSLAIFFAGLTLFLIPLRPSIASIVGSLSTLIFVAYVATAAWPLFHIQCPYRTPLSTIIHDITFTLRKYMLRTHLKYASLKKQEHEAAHSGDAFVVPAFEWLLSMSSNPSVHCVVVQAVGGLHKSSWIEKLIENNLSFQHAWLDLLCRSTSFESPDSDVVHIHPDKLDSLERVLRTALHIREIDKASTLSYGINLEDVGTALQSFPAPTRQWESVAIALLWHYGFYYSNEAATTLAFAQKAWAVLACLISDPREKETELPAIVWEDLLEAASSCPSIVLLPDLSDPFYTLNKMITDELTRRVDWGWERLDMYDNLSSFSFEIALKASENFVWSLLLPFDKHRENPLDSEKVQRLLSLIYAILSHGLCSVGHELFFGICKQLIRELQMGSVTPNDEEAVCVAADALLQERITFQGDFGPNAVLLPSLLFLHCWKPRVPSQTRSTRKDILLTLIEINMFDTLHEIDRMLWHSVAPLVPSVIRRSFAWMSPESQPEDSQWLEYLSLPENSSTIVSMVAFQKTISDGTPSASVAEVKKDLSLFFSLQSLDCDTLQKCRTSLESHFKDPNFVRPYLRDAFKPNMKEARKVIDEFISKQSPAKFANPLRRLLRRSTKSPDPEARYPQVDLVVEPSSSNTTNSR